MSPPPPSHLPDRRIPGPEPRFPVAPFVAMTIFAAIVLVVAILAICTSTFRAPVGWGI
jgi:uncharacterized RDD family membrane protein YckC